ncbi:hypothetical protein HBI24_215600 [Parastagonospora nodorum]|nr:hypothetical protein HBH61_198220 [Parastagonospora nodorum]KAH5073928.1 hypothetical protein HBI73_184270 [Parastagonospora nodorum]KAH5571191.1 hypothetical protein HBI24_215600 [Parastagonospora nodorum]KAH5663698.1 hypothetical protein HBI44_237370 [Parastagonospora nodorum]KAH5712445.1 hypothetical protein HBI18_208220 [Parastagonospora nodorum]
MAANSEPAIPRQSTKPTSAGFTSNDGETQATNLRVCDTCIRKKVKCNQARPKCSHCSERGVTCAYSSKRRKPGPPPGSHHRSTTSTPLTNPGHQRNHEEDQIVTQFPSPAHSASTAGHLASHLLPNQELPTYSNLDASSTEEEDLVLTFFDILQDANPIFSRSRFLNNYRHSLCDSGLISTITTISARLTKSLSLQESVAVDDRIDLLLSSTAVQDNLFSDTPVLDQFRKSCILAVYEFHQFPGHQSWMRIGALTRMALRVGLDQLQNPRSLQPEWSAVSEEDLDEWRAIWWCIYRLDSYSNLSSGTPYLISEHLVTTAFILHDPQQSPPLQDNVPRISLSDQPSDVWKLLPGVLAHPDTIVANMHNITTTITRQVGSLMRLCKVRPQEEIDVRLTEVERRLSALRLALPLNWLNPKRNAFSNESHADHHARIVTLFQLLMARLLLALLQCGALLDEQWLISWQEVLEICQNIACIAEQWDSSFCVKVDPAISFVVFTTLVFLDIHGKSITTPDGTLRVQIEHDKTVLRLMLEQFATIWTLPRLLKLSYVTFSESIPGSLTDRHIKRIILRFDAPLHSRWLQFLADPHKYLNDDQ